MKLIVGLGNPGAKYAKNRHNIGFVIADEIAIERNAPAWRSKFQALLTEVQFGSGKAILLKPQTFMNLSGQSVGEAARFYKIEPKDIITIHDELDLAPGKIKHKLGGGHAGHNGLRSLHQHIGPDYQRLRIGIGHPGDKARVASYVLSDFAKADQVWLEDAPHAIARSIHHLVGGKPADFLNDLHRRIDRDIAPKKEKPVRSTASASKPVPESQQSDEKSLLQRLVDKFS